MADIRNSIALIRIALIEYYNECSHRLNTGSPLLVNIERETAVLHNAKDALSALNSVEERLNQLERSLARINMERVDIEEALAMFLRERGFDVNRWRNE